MQVHRSVGLMLFVLLCCTGEPAQAQPSVEYQPILFEVKRVSPVAGSAVDISLKWKAVVDGLLTNDIVADAIVVLTVGGATEATVTVPLVLHSGSGVCGDAPCGLNCGSSRIDGAVTVLDCDPVTCECTTPPIETALATNLILTPGKLLEVTISTSGGEPIPPVLRKLEWGSWQRRVVASRFNPAPNGPPGTYEIFLDWVIEFNGFDPGPWLPIDLVASVHGTYPSDGCSDLNYVECPDCCLEACVCSPPATGNCILWDLVNGATGQCSDDNDCPYGTLNGQQVQLVCDTGKCLSPAFTSGMVAPLVPGQPFIAYLLSPKGALPELDYSLVRADIELPLDIPTVSAWGLAIMAVLVLTGATLVLISPSHAARQSPANIG